MAHYIGVENTYRVVEYIESTGTQYIDTGFMPDQNSRIDIVVSDWEKTEKTTTLFGTQKTTNNRYESVISSGGLYRSYFGGSYVDFPNTLSIGEKTTVSRNGNIISIGDNVLTNTEKTFTSTTTLFLFAHNSNGTVTRQASLKLYSCKIYDKGVLCRDYVPCIDSDGVAGLYDKVDHKFYTNAGAGTFAVGATTGENVAQSVDVARNVVKHYYPVDNVARSVKKAYHEVNGVARLYFSPRVGSLEVGRSVYMSVNGVSTEFLVVHQGLPDDTMYDSSCDGTWLLQKDCGGSQKFWGDDNSIRTYANSFMHNYLNETYLGSLDANIQSAIKQVKIPYCTDTGNATVNYGVNGLSAKVFLLSGYEIGWKVGSESGFTVMPIDGAKLDYFYDGNTSTYSCNRRIASYNGSTCTWWTRSLFNTSSGYVNYVLATGKKSQSLSSGQTNYVRPALILPPETQVDNKFNVTA